MNYEEKNNLALKPQKTWESNHLNLKPDDMKKWLTKSPAAIKEQLTAQGNIFTTLLSYSRSVNNGFCEAESEMNPANYAAKMISNLLQEYQDPAKKMEMEEAGIDKKFIQNLMEDVKVSRLNDPQNCDGKISSELSITMDSVENGWKREKEHERNIELAANRAYELRLLKQQTQELMQDKPRLDAETYERLQQGITYKENRAYDDLKELGVTPEEAFKALKQREINEYNQRKTEDQKGQESRTAAVQRGDVITTYDPNDKDSTGHYNNVRHYYAKEDGSLKPISKEMAGEILKGKQSPNHEQSITNGQKIDAKAIMNYAKIDYGR
ncbi:MAG: hypothetical protein IJ525_05605 [Alphaproteobacteria bacterium]|nr:hypothetical protein [Alphaproteobacteria bacterium]